MPGGEWARERGVVGWGVTVYSAFNEPDAAARRLETRGYAEALEGLADGVHSANPALKVIPGGFASANSRADYTLGGYGPAVAPLLNRGKLDGIDLHTYYDVQYAPLEGGYGHSAQHVFEEVKRHSGITADINFYATEFNYKRRGKNDSFMPEEEAAKGFLTGFWDQVGVVKGDGRTAATRLALVWNVFHTAQEDPEYGLAVGDGGRPATARGRVLKMVLRLTDGMSFLSLDPKGAGVFVLEGRGRKLWVWQNRAGWTNRPGSRFVCEGIPGGARKLEVYGWDGLRRVVGVKGRRAVSVEGLRAGETYMFLATE